MDERFLSWGSKVTEVGLVYVSTGIRESAIPEYTWCGLYDDPRLVLGPINDGRNNQDLDPEYQMRTPFTSTGLRPSHMTRSSERIQGDVTVVSSGSWQNQRWAWQMRSIITYVPFMCARVHQMYVSSCMGFSMSMPLG